MSNPPDNVIRFSDTITLCEYTSPRNGSFGFWLYDKTQGMNLSMRAKTERDAFVEALTYYQKRLTKVKQEYASLKSIVDSFVSNFVEEDE